MLRSASPASLFGTKKTTATTPQELEKAPAKAGGREVPGTTQPIEATGHGGMDKKYYHNPGDKFGWLETKPEVVERELKAYKELDKIGGLNFPQTIEASGEDRPMLGGKDGDKQATSGYFVEHLEFKKTFKPKMMVFDAGIVARMYKQLPSDEAKLQMRNDIQAIKDEIEGIANVVGELTLTVNPETGVVHLLDVGPNENKAAGGEELATNAGKGLEKILTACT